MHEAAAVITFLSPGLRFFHQGQFQGFKKRISPHLVRGPEEPNDPNLEAFYEKLLAVLRQPVVQDGSWQLLECTPAWEGNWACDCFLAFSWTGKNGERLLAAVNFSDHQSQCYVRMPWADLSGQQWLSDRMGPAIYERTGEELAAKGLYLDVPAWACHVFDVNDAELGTVR